MFLYILVQEVVFVNQSSIQNQINLAVKKLRKGETIAYPTEAVYGLGCDPFDEKAVKDLFHVKQRPMDKGIILVAGSVEQIESWVELLDTPWEQTVLSTWPGPITWVLPIKKPMPNWITGGRNTVAIRVSNHPVVNALCEKFAGPIVSTSANITGHFPAKSCQEVVEFFGANVFCIEAELGGLNKPTEIRDSISGQIIRA